MQLVLIGKYMQLVFTKGFSATTFVVLLQARKGPKGKRPEKEKGKGPQGTQKDLIKRKGFKGP